MTVEHPAPSSRTKTNGDRPYWATSLRSAASGSEMRARGSPPPVPPIAVARPRLERLLDENPDRRVVLVRGPAGAGKTILVAQWAGAHANPCAWLTLDQGHNDPARLVAQLVETVEVLCPDAVGPVTVPFGNSGEVPLDASVLWDVLGAVTGRLGGTVNLVLDAVERVHDRAARHVLGLLVEHPPESVRIVLVSRSKPCIGLERVRLRGDLVDVGPTALRFQRVEIDALAANWADRGFDAGELEQDTLGWAAGLRLAQLEASSDDASSLALREPNGYASEYVREELIDGSPADLGAFLEVTCWLPSITGPLCAALARREPGRPALTLSEMERLPLLPVASRPGAFRYPPILNRALRDEYRRRDPPAALRAIGRAAEASRTAGELPTALELFLQADWPDAAADACAALASLGEPSLRRFDEILRRRPELAPTSPRLLPWRIRAAVAAGRVDEASALLPAGEPSGIPGARLGGPTADERESMVRARAAVAEHLGDAATLLACADRVLEHAAQGRVGPDDALQACCWRIQALAWSGEIELAKATLRSIEAPAGESRAAVARSWVAWADGDIGATAAGAVTKRSEDCARTAELALLAGSAHRERNQVAKAVPLLQEARTLAATYAHNVVDALAASELARCQRAAGASMDALEAVVVARAASPDLPYLVDVHLRCTEALVRLDQGDVAGAHAVVRAAPPGPETQLLAVRVALRMASTRAAEQLATITARTPRQAVEKLLLRAQLPDTARAERSAALLKAVTIGEPLGLIRMFLDEGEALSRQLSELACEHRDRALGRLGALARQELAQAPAGELGPPVEQLTARELAVLQMLPLRMSNREMAAQMYVSVNTLKTHVRAIYRKLDVPDRSAAVQRAKALQLV